MLTVLADIEDLHEIGVVHSCFLGFTLKGPLGIIVVIDFGIVLEVVGRFIGTQRWRRAAEIS